MALGDLGVEGLGVVGGCVRRVETYARKCLRQIEFDSLVNGRDLQLYNCVGSAGDTLEETCWVSTNGGG